MVKSAPKTTFEAFISAVPIAEEFIVKFFAVISALAVEIESRTLFSASEFNLTACAALISIFGAFTLNAESAELFLILPLPAFSVSLPEELTAVP